MYGFIYWLDSSLLLCFLVLFIFFSFLSFSIYIYIYICINIDMYIYIDLYTHAYSLLPFSYCSIVPYYSFNIFNSLYPFLKALFFFRIFFKKLYSIFPIFTILFYIAFLHVFDFVFLLHKFLVLVFTYRFTYWLYCCLLFWSFFFLLFFLFFSHCKCVSFLGCSCLLNVAYTNCLGVLSVHSFIVCVLFWLPFLFFPLFLFFFFSSVLCSLRSLGATVQH